MMSSSESDSDVYSSLPDVTRLRRQKCQTANMPISLTNTAPPKKRYGEFAQKFNAGFWMQPLQFMILGKSGLCDAR